MFSEKEEFDDTKGVIRISILKKNRDNIGFPIKNKRWNIYHITKT
jgi:hypothetical protein